MKRIDFIGAPGVGKSTLYRELLRQRNKGDKWLTPLEARVRIAKSKSFPGNEKSMRDSIKALILRTGPLKFLHPYCVKSAQTQQLLIAQQHYYKKLPELFCDYMGRSADEPLLKIMRAAWLLEDLEVIATINAHSLSEAVLFDEGLTQKIFTWFVLDNQFDLHTLPLPDAFVYFHCDPGIVHERMETREKTPFQHLFYGKEQIHTIHQIQTERLEQGAKSLARFGIKGIAIDASGPLKDNMARIQQFIKGL
jgi:hypothetical protein